MAAVRHPRRIAARLAARTGEAVRRLAASRRGGVALVTALALPPLVLLGLGVLQLQQVFTDRQRTQDVADAAALWGAQQLTVTPVGADQRTIAFADAQLQEVRANAAARVTAQVVGPQTIKVAIDTRRPSFFMNLLPLGGFRTHVESTAEGATLSPLCVMTFGLDDGDKAEIADQSKMIAPKCLVHTNERLEVAGSALLQAQTIEAGTGASGPMSPAANIGAPDVDDPFTSLDIDGPLICLTLLPTIPILLNSTLPAGAHCAEIEVEKGVSLTLAPGEHYFARGLTLKQGSRLKGDDVVMIFGPNGQPSFKDAASVTLSGRRSKRLAGFVIVATRDRTTDLEIDSDAISELTGTVYVPSATLNIRGSGRTAEASDWTVMAAKALKLTDQPQVQINANYNGSEVPVPGGVGNKVGTTHLL